MIFDKRQTNIAKGVGVLLLLWHHLFVSGMDKTLFISMFTLKSVPIESYIANFCKVCVAIFLILSGYGLTKSYEKYNSAFVGKENGIKHILKRDSIYIKNRWLQLMSNYWFVYLIFVPISLFFGRKFYLYYGKNPLNYIFDFLGISYLVHNNLDYTMNPTWWYMGVCTVFYLFFPLFYKALKKYPEAFLLLSFLFIYLPFYHAQLNTWLFPFVLGMYFAKYDLFYRIERLLKTSLHKILVCGISIAICAVLRYFVFHNSVTIDGFFGLSIIVFSYMFLSKIRFVNRILEEIGKYSGLIFMFHTFIYSFWFKSFIYGFKYPILIFMVMIVICYIIAVVLHYLMKITRYEKVFSFFADSSKG